MPKCKFCGVKLPSRVKTDVQKKTWMMYHMKVHHRTRIHQLAKEKKSWLDCIE